MIRPSLTFFLIWKSGCDRELPVFLLDGVHLGCTRVFVFLHGFIQFPVWTFLDGFSCRHLLPFYGYLSLKNATAVARLSAYSAALRNEGMETVMPLSAIHF